MAPISEIEASSLLADDNLFAAPRSQPTGEVSVKLPSYEWLCQKLEKLSFYYATIAYHVGLNAVLGLPHPGPTS